MKREIGRSERRIKYLLFPSFILAQPAKLFLLILLSWLLILLLSVVIVLLFFSALAHSPGFLSFFLSFFCHALHHPCPYSTSSALPSIPATVGGRVIILALREYREVGIDESAVETGEQASKKERKGMNDINWERDREREVGEGRENARLLMMKWT